MSRGSIADQISGGGITAPSQEYWYSTTMQDARGSVYLAGPIRHALDYDDATTWRDVATCQLEAKGIKCYSPLRGKEFLKQQWGELKKDGSFPCNPLSTAAGIVTRDRFDVERCDVMLVNLKGQSKVSIGTCIELGWADMLDKPIVLVLEPGSVHDHVMVTRMAGWITPTLEEAVELVDTVIG